MIIDKAIGRTEEGKRTEVQRFGRLALLKMDYLFSLPFYVENRSLAQNNNERTGARRRKDQMRPGRQK